MRDRRLHLEKVNALSDVACGQVSQELQRAQETHVLPWYVVPMYTPPEIDQPIRTCRVVNNRGEQVAMFEDIDDARMAVARVNGDQ